MTTTSGELIDSVVEAEPNTARTEAEMQYANARILDPSCVHKVGVTVPSWDIRQIAVCEAKGISVEKDWRILDYGCGPGRRVYELLDAGYQYVYGVDVIDYLELRAPEDRQYFHIAPNGQIPVPDATFDLIISDQVFEHVMDQPTAWQEIVRVLKPGGVSVHVIPAKCK